VGVVPASDRCEQDQPRRLQHIAQALQAPVTFFFEGVAAKSDGDGANVSELFGTKEGVRLSKAFLRIEAPELRRKIVRLVPDLADSSRLPSPNEKSERPAILFQTTF
jgi:hypothetical protein